MYINSLAPRKFEWHFRYVIFKWILVVDGWGIPCEIALILLSLDFTDDQSTLVQVMAWCRQATNHYLCQRWPRSLPPYVVIRPQWVNAVVEVLESQRPISQRVQGLIKEIHWKLFLLLIFILMIQSGDKLTHIMTAQRSWHLQSFVTGSGYHFSL